MNAAPEPGDIGVSRYPPAEGEREGGMGTAVAPGDVGVSRNPPAEGERSAPPEELGPSQPAQPNETNEAPPLPESSSPGNGQANASGAKNGSVRDSAVAPASGALQTQDLAKSPSVGPNSLPREPAPARNGPTTDLRAVVDQIDDEVSPFGTAAPIPSIAPLDPHEVFGRSRAPWDAGQVPGDTGVSRHPPAEGARTAPAGEQTGAAAVRPPGNIVDRNRGSGVCRNPPAEGERNSPPDRTGLDGATGVNEPEWYTAHEQATAVTQVHNIFPSPYAGRNSLMPKGPASNSLTGTLFLGARLWESERSDG